MTEPDRPSDSLVTGLVVALGIGVGTFFLWLTPLVTMGIVAFFALSWLLWGRLMPTEED